MHLVNQYNAYTGFHVASHLSEVPEMNSPCNFWPDMILPTSIFRRWQDFISHSHQFYYCASLDSRDDAVKKSAETTNIPTSSAPVGFCTSAIRLYRCGDGQTWSYRTILTQRSATTVIRVT